MNINMTCNSTNVLYVIECQGCRKKYIGETGNLRFRTNPHRDHVTKNIALGVSRHLHTCVSGWHELNIMPRDAKKHVFFKPCFLWKKKSVFY